MSCSSNSFLSASQMKNLARDNSIIYKEICAIQQHILLASDAGSYSVVINGDTPITSHYGINSLNIVSGGTGYTVDSAVISINTAGGTDFSASPVISNIDGSITSITINDGGTGYVVGEPLVVTGTNGVDFDAEVASVDLAGAVTGIIINEYGTGYRTTPYVEVLDSGSGSGFIGTLSVSAGTIDGYTIIDSGRDYGVGTYTNVVGNGTGALITVVSDYQKWAEIDPVVYFNVWTEVTTNPAVLDQILYIEKYFTDLGYNFQIRVNPQTMDTLQWQIYWS